jgi:hypothetical protein
MSEEERTRFMQLIQDIKSRKDDYSAQLASLTVAGLSDPVGGRGNEFRSQIIASLLTEADRSQEAAARQAELWKARLVLAIGEILDQEEEELLQSLSLLDASELQMLQDLQGDDSKDSDELLKGLQQIRANLEKPRTRDVRLRFQAWQRLMRCQPAPDVELWLASSRDNADEIFNLLEKKDQAPLPILRLTIPREIGVSPVHLINQVLDFQAEAAPLQRSVTEDLHEICQAELSRPLPAELLLPGSGNYIDVWDALVEKHFPKSSHGSAFLTFYLLPATSIAELLSLETNSEPQENGLLAVLQREIAD